MTNFSRYHTGIPCTDEMSASGFPLYFGSEIQGLFKVFQGH